MERLVHNEKKIRSLTFKHKQFENLIQKASSSLSTDSLEITDLKKKKLKIRDEISRLKR
ncbi:MAG: DUF465 domain-containing protein [Rickettsiales bacterium]|nr:DUF465 domain-containing protein [Rickettsiales bacterium]|tara:strand:+ start:400 stop:576 length:177 start_codon:yes stop_codon:yes gene_type:complete